MLKIKVNNKKQLLEILKNTILIKNKLSHEANFYYIVKFNVEITLKNIEGFKITLYSGKIIPRVILGRIRNSPKQLWE